MKIQREPPEALRLLAAVTGRSVEETTREVISRYTHSFHRRHGRFLTHAVARGLAAECYLGFLPEGLRRVIKEIRLCAFCGKRVTWHIAEDKGSVFHPDCLAGREEMYHKLEDNLKK